MTRIALTLLLLIASLPLRAASPVTLQGVQYCPMRTDGTNGVVKIWVDPNSPRNTTNGAYFSELLDLSGNSNRLTNSTAASQPLMTRRDNRGNLLVQSESFNTTWSRARVNAFGVTDTGATGAGSFANTARTTDPLGGNTADFIQQDATAAQTHQISIATTLGATNFSATLWAKADATNVGRIYVSATAYAGVLFDLNAGTLGNYVGGGGAIVSKTIADAGNGWWKIDFTATAPFAAVPIVVITIGAGSYDGDNTSGYFLWGASLRKSDWDTNYIATSTYPAYPGKNGFALARFDGTDDFLKAAPIASLVQPETVVWVGMQETWTASDRIFDGNTASSVCLRQDTASPQIDLFAGDVFPNEASWALGSLAVLGVCANGAASYIQVNRNTATTGSPGSNNGGGFTLGAAGGGTVPGNIQTGILLVFQGALNSTWQSYHITHLARKYGISIY